MSRPDKTEIPESSGFGAIAPAKSQKRVEKNQGAKAAGALVVAIVLIALAAFGIMRLLGTFDTQVERAQRIALETSRVESDLKNIQPTLPDLTAYRYVSTSNLIGPKFTEATIGDVEETGGSDDAVMRNVTTEATYRNKSLLITIPLTIPYLYSDADETWTMGEVTQGEPVIAPSEAPSSSLITADMDALLDSCESGLSARYKGAQVNSTSNLTAEGGTISATLMKVDGRTTHTCNLEISLAWEDGVGWVPTARVVSQDKQVDAAPAQKLECSSGDTVQLKGTVKTSSTSARLVLALDSELELIIDDESHDITELSLDVKLEDNGDSLVGKHITVTGVITTGLSTRTAPAGIAATQIQVG